MKYLACVHGIINMTKFHPKYQVIKINVATLIEKNF